MSKKLNELKYLLEEAGAGYEAAQRDTQYARMYEGELSPRMIREYANEISASRRYISCLHSYLEQIALEQKYPSYQRFLEKFRR